MVEDMDDNQKNEQPAKGVTFNLETDPEFWQWMREQYEAAKTIKKSYTKADMRAPIKGK